MPETPQMPRETLDDLQQVDSTGAELRIPAVPVVLDGPVHTHELPARLGVVSDFPVTAVWQMVLGEDLKRKRLTIVADADWVVSHDQHGGGRWPANVPLVVTHTSAVWARQATDPAVLTVIPEEWAD